MRGGEARVQGRGVRGQEKRQSLPEGRQERRMQQAGPENLRHANQRGSLFR